MYLKVHDNVARPGLYSDWRDRGGNEVDLVLERDRKLTAVECKLKEKPWGEDVQGIRKLEKNVAGLLICGLRPLFKLKF